MGIRTRALGRTLGASATIAALTGAALLGAGGPAAVAAGNPTTLSCVLAGVSATVTLDSGAVVAPASVAAGGTFSVSLTPTVTVAASTATALAGLGIVSAAGSVSGLVVDGVNVSPASIALPASIPFATTPVLSGQPLALAASAPVTAGPFTAGTSGSATLTLGGASSGITAAVSGLDASGNVIVGPLTVQCNPPTTDADLATVPIVGHPIAACRPSRRSRRRAASRSPSCSSRARTSVTCARSTSAPGTRRWRCRSPRARHRARAARDDGHEGRRDGPHEPRDERDVDRRRVHVQVRRGRPGRRPARAFGRAAAASVSRP